MNVRALVAAALGLLMVMTAVNGLPKYVVPVSICVSVLVLVGIRIRMVATLAVLFVIGIVALGDASSLFSMLSGLAAVTYLLAAYPLRWPSTVNALRYEVIVPALLFGCAALLAAAIPVGRSSWLPLAAPVAVVGIYVLTLWPFTQNSGDAVER